MAARHATATPWVVQHPKGVTVKLGREAAPWAVTGRLSCNANKSKAGVQTTGPRHVSGLGSHRVSSLVMGSGAKTSTWHSE